MAEFEDKVIHELDGIKEYDNPMPGWLMAIWWGSILFAAAYLIFYALAFGEGSMEAEYRAETDRALAAIQVYLDANPLVPSPEELLAGARDPVVLELGASRYARFCASCHGAEGQGLIGPNLTDDHWLHGGSIGEVFLSVAKGWPAKGMPPWGRAMPPAELTAVVSYVRSLQGTHPAGGRAPEGQPFTPEPLPEN